MVKINIAELLKDCPKGMELDCATYDNVQFDIVQDGNAFPIKINTPEGRISLSKYGSYSLNPQCKCIIFPKGKTTWEGFHRPFEPGDIVITDNNEHAFIYSGENDSFWECYCGVYCGTRNVCTNSRLWSGKSHNIRLATEEEKEKLLQVIKDNGYKWNAETKTLEKLSKPKFKVGDKVRHKNNHGVVFTITSIEEDSYVCGAKAAFWFDDQDDYELVPNKFDITTLKPFESRVLVRDSEIGIWLPDFFGCLDNSNECPYMVVGGIRWKNCIPYEGNEHLLGKCDDCIDFYKNW